MRPALSAVRTVIRDTQAACRSRTQSKFIQISNHNYAYQHAVRYSLPHVQQTRSFVRNRQYPKCVGSSLEVSDDLIKIGNLLTIATAPLYITTKKLEYAIKHMKSTEEVERMQTLLLLCDAKRIYPTSYVIGTFINACLKNDMPDTALEFVLTAEQVAKYLPNGSLVRLLQHYAKLSQESTNDSEIQANYEKIIDNIVDRMETLEFRPSFKFYQFQIENAKRRGNMDLAVKIAKSAADVREINAHTILTLIDPLDDQAHVQAHIPLVKYLVQKGDVFPNAKLEELLDSAEKSQLVEKARDQQKKNETIKRIGKISLAAEQTPVVAMYKAQDQQETNETAERTEEIPSAAKQTPAVGSQ